MSDGLLRDVRFAARRLRRSPGFTTVAVLTLALGIAGTTSIFSVVEGVLLRSLPYRQPDRLVAVWATDASTKSDRDVVSFPDLQDWQRQARQVRGLAGFDSWHGTLTLPGQPALKEVGGTVSPGFFTTLGTSPVLGRGLRPSDGELDATPVVVLSYGLWQQRFGGSAAILGRTIPVDGRSYQVVGVLPRSFRFPLLPEAHLWRPLVVREPVRSERGNHFLRVVGRLAPGATVASARREMSAIARRLAAAYPSSNAGHDAGLASLRQEITGSVRSALLVLLGAVALVLLIACGNIAGLSLTRTLSRRGELAVRAALGASRGRLARQVLVESLLISGAAGALGILATWVSVPALVRLAPAGLPRSDTIGVDATVLAVSVLVSLVVGLVSGVLPALWAGRLGPRPVLADASGRHGTDRRAARARTYFVVGEVMLSLVLTVGAGLLLKSFVGLRAVDPGLAPSHVLTFNLDLWPSRYDDSQAVRAYSTQVLERVRALPGVQSASAVTGLPFTADNDMVATFGIADRPAPAPGHEPFAKLAVIMPGYFRTLGIRLLRGRPIGDHDDGRAAPVVVVNQAMARRYWPGQDAIGQRIILHAHTGGETDGAREVVGVVGDVRQYGLRDAPRPEMYVPQLQFPLNVLTVTLRTTGAPKSLVPAVRRALDAIDPDIPLGDIRTLDALVSRSVSQPRFYMVAVTLFAALALLLCALGVYGVIAYGVRQRAREIGIRMAVGARASRILGLVLREAVLLAAAGIALGLGVALAASRVLGSLLYGVRPTDAGVYLVVSGAVLGMAVLAALLPARRATQLDPMSVLRSE